MRALATLAQLKEGKIQIQDLDKFNQIIELQFDVDKQTRLKAVQLIAVCSNNPPAH